MQHDLLNGVVIPDVKHSGKRNRLIIHRMTVTGPYNARSNQSIKIAIDLSVDKSMKIGKSDLTDWYRSYRSIGRNRWHTPFVYRFISILPIPSILSEDTSVLLFRLIQKWKLSSCKQWICWQWNCNWKSKDQTIYYHFFKKNVQKNLIFSLKPALKSPSDGRNWPGL